MPKKKKKMKDKKTINDLENSVYNREIVSSNREQSKKNEI